MRCYFGTLTVSPAGIMVRGKIIIDTENKQLDSPPCGHGLQQISKLRKAWLGDVCYDRKKCSSMYHVLQEIYKDRGWCCFDKGELGEPKRISGNDLPIVNGERIAPILGYIVDFYLIHDEDLFIYEMIDIAIEGKTK